MGGTRPAETRGGLGGGQGRGGRGARGDGEKRNRKKSVDYVFFFVLIQNRSFLRKRNVDRISASKFQKPKQSDRELPISKATWQLTHD